MMKRTQLRNIFQNRKYTKQRNYCVSISKKVKRKSYLIEKNELEEKNFKPFYLDKTISLGHHFNEQ